jgi:NitT/TauT family transport system substrate-binding protein
MADMAGRTIAYSTTGSSTHANVLSDRRLQSRRQAGCNGRVPGDLHPGDVWQIDAGWAAPPMPWSSAQGEIRVIVRSSELPLVKGHSVRVIIANSQTMAAKPDLYRRFMRAYRETVDWMYAGDGR